MLSRSRRGGMQAYEASHNASGKKCIYRNGRPHFICAKLVNDTVDIKLLNIQGAVFIQEISYKIHISTGQVHGLQLNSCMQ